jgi:iron complex outermembrane receptor protein
VRGARSPGKRFSKNARRAVAAALAGALALGSTTAFGDARSEARTHFKKGMDAISNGKYEDGISELQKAYEILPHPNVLYNIARAYAESGDLENAVANYRKYLDGNPPDRADVVQIVQNLEARITRQQASLEAARETTPTASTSPTNSTPTANNPTTPTHVDPTNPKKVIPSGNPAPPNASGINLGEERTEDVFAETVVTASRAAQSPLDAPSSTSIVTQQDIRLSGITKIPELLRRLAGVDIMEVNNSQTEVSLRGFNQRLSNKVLVLIDGRSVYVDLLGATLWQTLPIGVEDIDRIEVVRGPGSALYGADAANGVINIITKAPGDGTSGINAGYGDHNQTHGSLWATGKRDDFAWRASAGYDYLPKWSRDVADNRVDLTTFNGSNSTDASTARINIQGTRRIGRDITVGLGGGLMEGNVDILGIGPLNNVDMTNTQVSDVVAFFDSKHIQIRAFYNRFRTNFGLESNTIGQSLLPGAADSNVLDGEAQYVGQFETGKDIDHDLHIGISYRLKQVSWTYLDENRSENHEAFFIHDEVKIKKVFALVGDYRLDYDPYLAKPIMSPRGALLLHPTQKSTIRASVATAFRTPTFLESYLSLPVQLPVAGAALDSRGVRTDDPSFKVQPERVFSAELGYLTQDSDIFTFDSALFFTQTNDFIRLATNRPVSLGDVTAGNASLNPETGLYPVFGGGFENSCSLYNTYGAELGARIAPVEGLDVYGNYTFNYVNQDDSSCTAAQKAANVNDSRTSVNKLNAGVQVRTGPGIDGSIDFHYVSPQTWDEQVESVSEQKIVDQAFHLDAYYLLNARIGYRFLKNQAELSAVAFNLTGYEHREHPFGQTIGRRVMGFFTYKF